MKRSRRVGGTIRKATQQTTITARSANKTMAIFAADVSRFAADGAAKGVFTELASFLDHGIGIEAKALKRELGHTKI